MAYFSAQLINKSTHNEQLIYFNNFYSKKIKLNENDSVKIKTIHRNHSFATSITIGNFILIVFIFVVIFLSMYFFSNSYCVIMWDNSIAFSCLISSVVGMYLILSYFSAYKF